MLELAVPTTLPYIFKNYFESFENIQFKNLPHGIQKHCLHFVPWTRTLLVVIIFVPKSLPPVLQAEAVQKAAREVGWAGREAEARTLRPSGLVGSRQGSKCG